MKQNTLSYKVQKYLMFAGPGTPLLCSCYDSVPIYCTCYSYKLDGIGKQNRLSVCKLCGRIHRQRLLVRSGPYCYSLCNCSSSYQRGSICTGISGNKGIKGQNFFRAGFFVPNLIGGIVLGYIWKFVFNRALVAMGSNYSRSSFHIITVHTKRSHVLSDLRVSLAVRRLHDADLCSRIHERIRRCKGGCED